MRSKWDRGQAALGSRYVRIGERRRLIHRPIFISPRSGAVVLAHDAGRSPPKPDGLVRKTSNGLSQNHSRQDTLPFVHKA